MTRKNKNSDYDLKAWRKAMGMTQAQASKFLGYSSISYYQDLESGRKPRNQHLEWHCRYALLEKTGVIKKIMQGIQFSA